MGTIYIDTGGSADNSGSSDVNTADLTGATATRVSAGLIQLDVGTDLSGVVTAAGATQSSINIAGATNSSCTIFWITAKDDGLDQVTVTPDPTGMTTNAWKIGGRHLLTSARVEGALRAGDTAIFNNSPAAAAATMWTFRIAGDSTSGSAKSQGKTGVRPVLNTTNTAVCVSSAVFNSAVENLEIDQDGASGNAVSSTAGHFYMNNAKISDGGGAGFITTNTAFAINCEITNTGTSGINCNGGNFHGLYIHDLTGDGIVVSTGSANGSSGGFRFCIIDTCTGRGINYSATNINAGGNSILAIEDCDVYGCGNSGLEVADADAGVRLYNNIFQDNGNAAGEFNVEWAAGAAEYVSAHGYNLFYHAGGGGGANLSGLTANGTELTSDPLFTNPAAGDFTLQSGSPCKATGYPGAFLGGPTGYLDMGAVQRQEAGGGAAVVGKGLISGVLLR